jgi:hypothetical protein
MLLYSLIAALIGILVALAHRGLLLEERLDKLELRVKYLENVIAAAATVRKYP